MRIVALPWRARKNRWSDARSNCPRRSCRSISTPLQVIPCCVSMSPFLRSPHSSVVSRSRQRLPASFFYLWKDTTFRQYHAHLELKMRFSRGVSQVSLYCLACIFSCKAKTPKDSLLFALTRSCYVWQITLAEGGQMERKWSKKFYPSLSLIIPSSSPD